MFYVYILKSKKWDKLYFGSTNNITKRIKEHNSKLNSSTRRYAPWSLVYFEGYAGEFDARDREKKIKQFGRVYSQLKRRIQRSLKS